jgi:glutamate formiminotransferase
MAQYILSDPNFSDGTRREVIEQIVDPFRGRAGVKLIGYEPIRTSIAFPSRRSGGPSR